MEARRTPRTVRLSEAAETLLQRFAAEDGITYTGIMELALRALGRERALRPTEPCKAKKEPENRDEPRKE